MGNNRINLQGQRFGKWTVLSYEGHTDEGIALWRCRCDCGREGIVLSSNLRQGKSKSCGCSRRKWKK